MSDKTENIEGLKEKIRDFIKERNWEKAHSPKNVSMSIAIEAAELMEHFQWMSEEDSRRNLNKEQAEEIRDEIADVAIYLLDLCNMLNIDLSDAVKDKLIKNNIKYPVGSVNSLI